MAGERVRRALDREPIWRRVEGRIDNRASRLRNRPGGTLKRRIPQFPNRNFGGGIAIGVVQAAISIVLERTVGIPFGADTEMVDTTITNEGTVYTVNVDSPFENMAQAKAYFEANTGFTALLTDLLEVRSVSLIKTRPLRDTYQIEILVED
jgi:hypothetical protein